MAAGRSCGQTVTDACRHGNLRTRRWILAVKEAVKLKEAFRTWLAQEVSWSSRHVPSGQKGYSGNGKLYVLVGGLSWYPTGHCRRMKYQASLLQPLVPFARFFKVMHLGMLTCSSSCARDEVGLRWVQECQIIHSDVWKCVGETKRLSWSLR